MRSCPSCDKPLKRDAKDCPCGWVEPAHDPAIKSGEVNPALGYIQCDWKADGERCLYPGSLSRRISGAGGPWYCRLHFDCDSPMFGSQIIQASKDYRHPTQEERQGEHLARANETCRKLGLTTVAEKRAWLKTEVRKLTAKMIYHAPREPGEDREEA